MLVELSLFDCLVELDEPQGDFLLVFFTSVRAANLKEQALNEASHVTKYANTDNFHQHLVEIFMVCITRDVPVSD